MRLRVSGHYLKIISVQREFENMAAVLQRELGVKVPYQYVYDYESFFAKCALGDFLDAVTVIFKAVEAKGWKQLAAEWLGECRRAMQEENIGYRIDQDGGVHPLVDVEFEIQRVAAIQVLTGGALESDTRSI